MYDVIVIGCGVVGAAAAYSLAQTTAKVLVLEAENDIAAGTTKANSAILHAGYDPKPGTKMAKLNVEGVRLAKTICEALDVPRIECGSYVIATDQTEEEHLMTLYEQGVANNVQGLKLLSGSEVLNREPNLNQKIVKALYASSAAIVSPWEFALAMAECAVKNGVTLQRNSKVIAIDTLTEGFCVHTDKQSYMGRFVINAAGLASEEIHAMVAKPTFHIKPTRGEYYLLDKAEGTRVHSVIFQCPTKQGKGVLVAPTVHGNCIVGPNADDVEGDDCATTSLGQKEVAQLAYRSVPSLDLRASIRSFAGVRANTDMDDFIIEFAVPGFLDLAGIKSPGLSAAPAIGEEAVRLLKEHGLEVLKRADFHNERKRIRFKDLSAEEKNALIKEEPEYGRVICRCETITEGEIKASLRTPIPPLSVDGVKRRCNAGMGRCQGGFCGPRVVEILCEHYGLKPKDVLQEKEGSQIIFGETKQEV